MVKNSCIVGSLLNGVSHEGKSSRTGLSSQSTSGLPSPSFIPAVNITEPRVKLPQACWIHSPSPQHSATGQPTSADAPLLPSTTLSLSEPFLAAAHGWQGSCLHLPITDRLPTNCSSSSLFAVIEEYNRRCWESSLIVCYLIMSWWTGDEATQTKLEKRLSEDSISLKILSSETLGTAHLFKVERGAALQVILWFKQNVGQCRYAMGTWAKSGWLWMALKTTVSPRTVPGEEWFPSMQKEVSTAGRSESQWCASSGEETSEELYFGDSMRKPQTSTAGLLRHPDCIGCVPMVGYGVNHQALESRRTLRLPQTCMMAAASQGPRAPCGVGLGGPDMGSPALGGLSTNFYLVAEKQPTLELLRSLCNPKANLATFLLWGP